MTGLRFPAVFIEKAAHIFHMVQGREGYWVAMHTRKGGLRWQGAIRANALDAEQDMQDFVELSAPEQYLALTAFEKARWAPLKVHAPIRKKQSKGNHA